MTKKPRTLIHTTCVHSFLRYSRRETRRLLLKVMRGERATGWSVSVAFVADAVMQKLNTTFLRPARTTDVLSFSYSDAQMREGEIVVNLDQARRQAPSFGTTFTDEVSRLLVHGMLHLIGHRDHTERTRLAMRDRENHYLSH